MITTRLHRLTVAGAAVLLTGAALAGCSNSKKPTAAAGSTTSAAATGSVSSAAATSSPASASSEAAQTFAAGSGKGSKFCNQLGIIAAQEAKLGPNGSNTDLQTSFKEIESLKGPLESSAPAAIKADLSTLFDYVTQLDGIMSKAGYDYTKVNPTDLATLEADSQKFQTAAQNVDNYVTQACGIDTGGGTGAASSG